MFRGDLSDIQVTLQGLRRDASILDKENVVAEIDLSHAQRLLHHGGHQ